MYAPFKTIHWQLSARVEVPFNINAFSKAKTTCEGDAQVLKRMKVTKITDTLHESVLLGDELVQVGIVVQEYLSDMLVLTQDSKRGNSALRG